MSSYHFDTHIDRTGTGALKIDALAPRWGRTDLLPLWVADMDFPTPDFILDALRDRLAHPILGYTAEPADYRPAIVDWMAGHHDWRIAPEWISFVPGVVKGIAFVLDAFTQPGDKILIQPPVYHLFRLTIERTGRTVVDNPLRMREDGQYEMDFDQLAAVAEGCKVLVLCNPHNPGGRCWDRATLARLAEFCAERKILVVSDEIHADMALFGARHCPFAAISACAAANSITLGAPTKTFNLAGVVSSYAIVPDDGLRQRFFDWLQARELNEPTVFAPIATVSAFRHGEKWRREMLAYVEDNIRFVEAYCREHLPAVRPIRPEASFLVWLDCRELGLAHDDLLDLFVDKARLALNDGEMFGTGGAGFMRLNVGTPRAVLEQAMQRLAAAVAQL